MRKIENEQSMIVGLVANNTNTVASTARSHIGMIDAGVNLIVDCVDEPLMLSSSLINIVNIAICRVPCL